MQTERREAGTQGEGNTACPSCRATLVAGMRFCRMCGYRLGEGVEEYAATQLFDKPPAAGAAPPPTADPFAPKAPWSAQPIQPLAPFQPAAPFQAPGAAWNAPAAKKRSGWMWVWIIIICLVILGTGVGVAVTRNLRQRRAAAVAAAPTNSLVAEADGFETADGGGAFLEGLAGPNSSWEGAGIFGGDVIISFDGKQVRDDDAMRRILGETPPGKPVEVVFIRDNGPPARTTLTTTDRRDWKGMEPIDGRPGGRGVLGVDVGNRMRVPDLNIYGVELRRVHLNRPAHLAGLQKGDVVVEFNGKIIRTPGDLRLRIYEAVPGNIANITVVRDGQRVVIPVKMGWGKDE